MWNAAASGRLFVWDILFWGIGSGSRFVRDSEGDR
jgi:hypothetical protein